MLAELVDHVIGVDPDEIGSPPRSSTRAPPASSRNRSSQRTPSATTTPSAGPRSSPSRVNVRGLSRAPQVTAAVSPLRSHGPVSG